VIQEGQQVIDHLSLHCLDRITTSIAAETTGLKETRYLGGSKWRQVAIPEDLEQLHELRKKQNKCLLYLKPLI